MPITMFSEPIAEQVWRSKYRLVEDGHASEPDISQTWSRVALALSSPEAHHRDEWRARFEAALSHFRFLPGGRILAGAGSGRRLTLFNCFVMGSLHDSIDGIFSSLAETMLTMQAGGGVGCDFSTLRPAGMPAAGSGNIASGPLSFMQVWDQACATLVSTGSRRGAMMATLRCDHPDIERFIDAKRDLHSLQHFNLSVLVSDAFMRAVEQDEPWPLVFPLAGRSAPAGAMVCERKWSGSFETEQCIVLRTVSARALWERLQKAAFECGDPGVIFIDRVESGNNLYYAETISATNPCGEVPLPPHGACNLGSINLTQFVNDPFGSQPRLDLQGIAATASVATRMLDNVYEVSSFPLKAQEKVAHASRRIGLGITGLADALAMLGVRYGSGASLDVARTVMQTICHAAYRTSIELAQERGAFPECNPQKYIEGAFVRSLPRDMVEVIRHKGIRNSHLTAIAPAGSISLLANNVSSGVEPIYAMHYHRNVRQADGTTASVPVRDYAWMLYRKLHGEKARLPESFAESRDIDVSDQLRMQAVLQSYVDQSISKTINLPSDADLDACMGLFGQAYQLGLKGCTMFRPRAGKAGILSPQGSTTTNDKASP
ncbi:adenosylcobalamin-dependent ribonucleoside-diphosphate reductase [Noviherbaspirillum sp.]|uniref:adenosylcobalamin-dependent ribonucleoside-diphosphate reductase n=1 Tax=Noviherbaspirillum sp. TaxID=1926288 RepID=UPI002B49995B|nr:adenosylcobalamin-dependent ribonucleoside-diphosphate reductase [Noviherbaspirillum sp.]HJV79538.1 adenosylcobalamin-dependent ribonucleoside-diphosphate reductase [Noviherbaspirillum sp.]